MRHYAKARRRAVRAGADRWRPLYAGRSDRSGVSRSLAVTARGRRDRPWLDCRIIRFARVAIGRRLLSVSPAYQVAVRKCVVVFPYAETNGRAALPCWITEAPERRSGVVSIAGKIWNESCRGANMRRLRGSRVYGKSRARSRVVHR